MSNRAYEEHQKRAAENYRKYRLEELKGNAAMLGVVLFVLGGMLAGVWALTTFRYNSWATVYESTQKQEAPPMSVWIFLTKRESAAMLMGHREDL